MFSFQFHFLGFFLLFFSPVVNAMDLTFDAAKVKVTVPDACSMKVVTKKEVTNLKMFCKDSLMMGQFAEIKSSDEDGIIKRSEQEMKAMPNAEFKSLKEKTLDSGVSLKMIGVESSENNKTIRMVVAVVDGGQGQKLMIRLGSGAPEEQFSKAFTSVFDSLSKGK
mgnify:CR=1 FL=1